MWVRDVQLAGGDDSQDGGVVVLMAWREGGVASRRQVRSRMVRDAAPDRPRILVSTSSVTGKKNSHLECYWLALEKAVR